MNFNLNSQLNKPNSGRPSNLHSLRIFWYFFQMCLFIQYHSKCTPCMPHRCDELAQLLLSKFEENFVVALATATVV